jgi:hypothetical protein
MHAYINETPKMHVLASNHVVGAIIACLCDAPFDRYAIARKKIHKKKYQKIKSHKVVIFHVCVGAPYIQPIVMEVCTSVKVTNVINRVNFCGCRLRGLVSAKGRI